MRTIRAKFYAVVAVCLLPGVLASVLLSRDLEEELTHDARATLSAGSAAFTDEIADRLASLEVAAKLIAVDPDGWMALRSGNEGQARRLVAGFLSAYPTMHIFLTDHEGKVFVHGDRPGSTGSLASLPELGQVLGGKPYRGLMHLSEELGAREDGEEHSLVVAEPVVSEGATLGAVVAAYRLDQEFLSKVSQKTGLALSMRSPEATVSTPENPAADEVEDAGVVTSRAVDGGHYVALTSFEPEIFKDLGDRIIVTASLDLTHVREDLSKNLWKRLGFLLASGLGALLLSTFIARRMHDAAGKIRQSLSALKERRYELVRGVRTNDELGALAQGLNTVLDGLKERDKYRDALGRYLSRAAFEKFQKGEISLGGESLSATVLFSDIRGFTALAEKMKPAQILNFLNQYFTGMVDVALKYDGVVDKYIGDGLMVVWGPPEEHPEDPLRAVRAAVEMRAKLEELNQQFERQGFPRIRIGIGIHSGEVIAGNIGCEQKMEYTVIGDTVNLASRLESLTKELKTDVVISEDTYRKVAPHVKVEPLDTITVRGREQAIGVYRLVGLAQPV